MDTDDQHEWLYRFTPREWLRASLGEFEQARGAFHRHNRRAGLAGARRAAGVALNGLLATVRPPDPRYGRTYMDHLAALAEEPDAPEVVRDAAKRLLSAPMPGGEVVALSTPEGDRKTLDAAEAIMAHAYAVVVKREG